MSAVLLKTQQRSFSVLFAKLATASSVDGNDPLKALKWGLDAYFWEGAHAIWGYEGEHTFDTLMTWLFVNNATRRIGLVGYWDVVAFDEFAGRKRVERSLVDTLKNYLANKSFSRGYGLIVDYLAEALRHLRTLDYSGDLDTLATLDPAMSKRDQDAVRKTFSGLAKLIFPARDGAPEELEELLRFAIEGRKRVKDQIIRLDDMMAASGSHFTYMLGRVDQDHYDAARARCPLRRSWITRSTSRRTAMLMSGGAVNGVARSFPTVFRSRTALSMQAETAGRPRPSLTVEPC